MTYSPILQHELHPVCIDVPKSVVAYPINDAKCTTRQDHRQVSGPGCIVSSVVLFLVLVFVLIGYILVAFITMPPLVLPEYQIEQVSVSLYNLTDTSEMVAKWDISVSVTNPNNHTDLKFNMIAMATKYNYEYSPGIDIRPFTLDRKSTTLQNSTVFALWQQRNYPPPLNFKVKLWADMYLIRDGVYSLFEHSAIRDTVYKNMTISHSSMAFCLLKKGVCWEDKNHALRSVDIGEVNNY